MRSFNLMGVAALQSLTRTAGKVLMSTLESSLVRVPPSAGFCVPP